MKKQLFIKSNFKILIVDDHPEYLGFICSQLGSEGYNISFAQDLKECDRVLHSYKPDIILLDIYFDNRPDGLPYIKTLRINPVYKLIPIILLTSHQDTTSIEIGFRNGANDYILKSASRIEMLARIDTHLKNSLSTKELFNERLELEEDIANVEELVNLRTKELIVANQLAEEANKLKSNFLRNISHEVRTPLNAISGIADILLENTDKNEEIKSDMENSISALLRVFDDIIVLSSLDSITRATVKEDINVNYFLENLKKLHQFQADQKGIDIELVMLPDSENINFKSDSKLLTTALNKIIQNAIQYSLKDNVTIECQFLAKEKKISFYVIDKGIGIKPDELDDIFDPFFHGTNYYKSAHGGTGIGLTIAKKIIDKFGSSINVISKENEGSSFSFSILIDNFIVESSKNRHEITNQLYGSVLIAEDEPISFKVLSGFLQKMGVKFIWAKNGEEAVQIYNEKKNEISCVLMDIKMPIMDGYEATKLIRKLSSSIPIIAQTAFAQPEEQALCFSSGCNAFIPKPVDKKLLEVYLKKYLTTLS